MITHAYRLIKDCSFPAIKMEDCVSLSSVVEIDTTIKLFTICWMSKEPSTCAFNYRVTAIVRCWRFLSLCSWRECRCWSLSCWFRSGCLRTLRRRLWCWSLCCRIWWWFVCRRLWTWTFGSCNLSRGSGVILIAWFSGICWNNVFISPSPSRTTTTTTWPAFTARWHLPWMDACHSTKTLKFSSHPYN